MKLSTIWSMPAMSLSQKLSRSRDWANQATASRLPSRLRYWVTIMELAKATRESSNIPGTRLEEILKNLEGGPK